MRATAEKRVPERATEVTVKPARVLVVDDDATLRGVIADALRADGTEVVEAGDGRAAFDVIAADLTADPIRYFDVIISDVQMPRCGGLELVGLLCLGGYRAPVVLLSGCVDASVRARARRLGATAILTKPFDVKLLRLIVANAGACSWWCSRPSVAKW